MRRGQRRVHQRIWLTIAPLLLAAVIYASLFPADPPVVEPPAVLTGGAP